MMKRVVGLTGTPAPNSLMDLWSQIYLLDQGERLGKTITGYRERYFIPGERSGHVVYKWHEKKESEQRIYDAISDIAVSMKTKNWLELPERIERFKPIKLAEKSRNNTESMKRNAAPYKDADVVLRVQRQCCQPNTSDGPGAV